VPCRTLQRPGRPAQWLDRSGGNPTELRSLSSRLAPRWAVTSASAAATARTRAKGRRERRKSCDGGLARVDELAELPLHLQPKLLRVLQDGEFERVGGTRTHKVDVRIVTATNRDLVRAIGEARFRDDLDYRVATFPIHVPPLRDRREDIPLLVWSIIERRQVTSAAGSTRCPSA